MAAGETRWKRTFATLLAGGVVGLFLAPIVAPALARWSRPAAKAALRTGVAIYERGRKTAEELREIIEDTAAELAAERDAAKPAEPSLPRKAQSKAERAAVH